MLKFTILFLKGSEVLRCLGYIRAYFLVALRMIVPKPYYVKVSYLPLKTSSSGKPIPVSEKEPRLKFVFQKIAPLNFLSRSRLDKFRVKIKIHIHIANL